MEGHRERERVREREREKERERARDEREREKEKNDRLRKIRKMKTLIIQNDVLFHRWETKQ